MDRRLDALDFAQYAASRWRTVAIACATAILLAGIVSILIPKRYTATASLMIDPPGGSDVRSSTAISPVYLDSLKTYEHLASSDSLFLEALDHLKIREKFSGRSVESLKRSILLISRPVNSRIIDIEATLDDPRAAQALAQYIAERTVARNDSFATQSEADAPGTRSRGTDDRKAGDEFASSETISALTDEIRNATDLKFRAERDLGEAKTDLAVQSPGSQEGAAARARVADLQAQADAFGRIIQSKSVQMERMQQRRDHERLAVLDPGIVPEKPSFPNTTLNIVVAALLSFTLSSVWLAIRFGYERAQMLRSAERVYSIR